LCSITLLLVFLRASILPQIASGQGLELNGGWAHITHDFGTDGFNAGAAWWFTKRVTVAADFESSWDTTTLSTFAFTQTGPIVVKSHLQSALVGPRIFFSTNWTDKHKLNPFGEAEFGWAHLSQDVTTVATGTVSASDSSFAWLLGGGAEYLFNPHWSGRANLDFMRTGFANEGQSRLRLILGVTYTFGSRERKAAAAAAPQPAPAPRQTAVATSQAKVHITSSPSGGEIYVDGKFHGNTPSDITLPVGEHSIKVLVNGREWSRTVQITSGDISIQAEFPSP
jgi:hypothetical protein